MKRVSAILFAAMLSLLVGTSVAYYNTSSLGYDDANIITLREDGIQVLYFDINYETVDKIIEYIKNVKPNRFITI